MCLLPQKTVTFIPESNFVLPRSAHISGHFSYKESKHFQHLLTSELAALKQGSQKATEFTPPNFVAVLFFFNLKPCCSKKKQLIIFRRRFDKLNRFLREEVWGSKEQCRCIV